MASSSQQTNPSWPPPTLDPAGPFATPLSEISWVMLAMGGAVLLLVLAALALALAGGVSKRFIANHRLVVGAGFVLPVIVLTAALIYGLTTTARLSDPPAPGELRIRVTGEMWWWRVVYFDGERTAFETANEIVIPAGQPVTIELTSADVIHSFWVPRLAAKLDMIPGRTNTLRLQADEPGIYRGQCTEFCGAAHALMAFEVVAVDAAAFDTWRLTQVQAAVPTPAHERGRAVFDWAGCGTCHQVDGTDANGRMGPNLTHFATRRTLAAGILPNDSVTLRRWIEDADALKPGARMPAYDRLSDADLEAVSLYLESMQ
jgi:cytochrome c oxidase subunit II